MLSLGHIELFVRDPQTSRDFYRDVLGFEVTVEQGPGAVWIKKDRLEILLRTGPGAPGAEKYEQAPAGLVLYTDDLAPMRLALEAKGLAFKGTVDTEKCLTFTDPDGHWFQLVNPADH
jgi:catechol 2,3-dioxygenase-like lactoylglutathione lyase family enzyme